MALKTEEHEQFKICGLCSQLVDESVHINASLKAFLLELLNVTESTLPEKTCLECYKSAIECRRFKEACQKSISKLEQKKVSDAMILGKSQSPVSPAKKTLTQPSKKKKILESLGLDPEQTEIDVKGGRQSRSAPSTTETPTPAPEKKPRGRPPGFSPKKKSGKGDKEKCRVIIKKLDRERADRQLEQLSISEVQKIIGKSTPSQTQKRGRPSTDLTTTPTATVEGPAAKRARKAAPEATIATPTPPKATKTAPARAQKGPNKANSNVTPTEASRSSFGRVRSTPNKSGYVYGDDMDDNTEPIDVEPTPPPPSAATKKGQQLPKGKRGPKPKPVEEEVVEVEPEDEDMEEVFPTIGPYQCEICQMITDTKVEFVEHIEGKHSDVVDEEVLLSLKSDIRKSNKKNGASEAPPPPKKPSPKKAAPTPPPKKAAPTPPPKKAAPIPPPKKAAPAPPPKKAAAPPPQPKKAVSKSPPAKAPTPSPKPEAKKGRPFGPASKTQSKPMGPASKTQSKPMGPASKTKPGPKPKSPAPQAVVAGSVKSPTKEKFHSWLCDICDTIIPRSSPSEIGRHKNTKSCQSALKRKKAAENKVVQVDDPLGGLESVPYGASAPVVVMDNAEEDILEPQDQEDDNSDEHSGAANGNGKPMVEIQNGHRERKERGPPKPILNFWDDTPAEEYASQFDKVVVEPVQRRDNAPIEFPF